MIDPAAFRERAPVVAGQRVPVDAGEFRTIRDAVERGERWYVAALVTQDGRTAFVRNRWSDGWTLPGGSVEPGESLREATVREVSEETGLDAVDLRPAGAVEQTFASGGRRVTGHMAVFAAGVDDPTIGTDLGESPDEIEAARWFRTDPDRLDGVSGDLLARLREAVGTQ
ncbi:MAG: NUDIX domain-containing protein [Haloarculaceae archaeon]